MTQDSIYHAIAGNLKNPYKHISEVINFSMERIEKSQRSTGITGIHSGFYKVDQFTMGMCHTILLTNSMLRTMSSFSGDKFAHKQDENERLDI